MTRWELHHADCRDAMRTMEAESVDAVVTDPPYGLEFMGKEWDAPWKNDPRSDKRGVVDPKAWGGNQDSPNGGNPYSRARIRTGAAHYRKDSAKVGQSFQAWCEEWAREALRVAKPGAHLVAFGGTRTYHRLACAIEDAGWEVRDCLSWLYGSGFPKSRNLDGAWHGWGTALKPAWEPVILARKPLDGTVASNVTKHGTGALNIDAARIGERWPANVALDEEAAAMLGEPSRFFYTAKASRSERGEGNTHPTVKPTALMRWLVRLVCPPGGLVLDPFNGSGSTGVAALVEGMRYVGCEREAEYVEISRHRLEDADRQVQIGSR